MKQALALFVGLSIVGSACTAPGTTDAPDRHPTAPQEITQFYTDWNFAASFSTLAERSRLRLVADLNEAEGLSRRLKAVSARLDSIEAKIWRIDVGVARKWDPGTSPSYPGTCTVVVEGRHGTTSMACELWQTEARVFGFDPSNDLVPPELIEPIDFVDRGSTITVKVEVWSLFPSDNALLVSSYRSRQEKTPVPNVQQLMSLTQSVPRQELHIWTLVDGWWLRNEANLVLLDH